MRLQLAAGSFRDLEKSRQSDAGCAARPSRSAEARFTRYGSFQLGLQGLPGESLEKRLAILPASPHITSAVWDSFIPLWQSHARAAKGIGLPKHPHFDQMARGPCGRRVLARVHVTSKCA